jgi:hypothetical protein
LGLLLAIRIFLATLVQVARKTKPARVSKRDIRELVELLKVLSNRWSVSGSVRAETARAKLLEL